MSLNARTGYDVVNQASSNRAQRPAPAAVNQQRYENTANINATPLQQTNNVKPSVPANRPVFQQPQSQQHLNKASARPAPNKLPNNAMPIMGMLLQPNNNGPRGKPLI